MTDHHNTFHGYVGQINQIGQQYIFQGDGADLAEQNRKILHLKYTIDREKIRGLVEEWAFNLRKPEVIKPLMLAVLGTEKDSPINLVKGITTMLLEPIVEKYQQGNEDELSVEEKSVEWPQVTTPPDKRLKQLIKRIGKACFDEPCADMSELRDVLTKRQQHIVLRVHIQPDHWDEDFATVFDQWLTAWSSLNDLRKAQLLLVTHLVKVSPDQTSIQANERDMHAYFAQHNLLQDIPADYELEDLNWATGVQMFCRRLNTLTADDLKRWVETRLQKEVQKLELDLDEQKVLTSIDGNVTCDPLKMSDAEAVIEKCLNDNLLSVPK